MDKQKIDKQKTERRRTDRQEINEATFGWLGTARELALVVLVAAAGLHQAAYSRRRSADRVLEDAARLFEKLRSQRLQKSLRCGLYQLANAGYRDGWKVTDEGYRRLKELVPKYIEPEERQWNGDIYLVMFDIPENLKRSRQKLRNTLSDIGFRMIQESVWMGFFDPTDLLEDDLRIWEIDEFVLITKATPPLGQAGLKTFVRQAFRLDNFNLRYEAFLKNVQEQRRQPSELALMYLSILKSDPKLPPSLLPADWLGDRAFLTYRDEVIKKLPHQYGDFVSAVGLI